MPKGNAAKIIARDLRKNQEKRRRRVKTSGQVHSNQQEYLRASSRKTLQRRHANDDDLEDILSAEDNSSDNMS